MSGRRGPGARGTTLTFQRPLLVPNSYEFNHIPPGITGAGWGLTLEFSCSETTREQSQVKGRARSLPCCCRKTCGGSGRLAQRREVRGERLPRAPSAERGAEEQGFPREAGARAAAVRDQPPVRTFRPRAAPLGPAQLLHGRSLLAGSHRARAFPGTGYQDRREQEGEGGYEIKG